MGRDNNMMMSRLMEYIMPGSRARNFDWPASSPRYGAIPPRAILRSDPVEDSGIQSSTPCLRVKVISRARESDAYWSRKRTNSLLCSLSKCLQLAAQDGKNITFYVFNLNFTDIFRLHSMNLAAFLCFLFLWLICGVLFGFYILLDRLFLHFFYTFNLH